MKLYSYFRSSAAFRVRIALNLKGMAYDVVPVHLRRNEQMQDKYLALNPEGLVPALQLDDGAVLGQSLAIIEYLEEICPNPALLPGTALERAQVRDIALTIACDIHPINNLRVMRYLAHELAIDEARRDDWYRHWCVEGLATVEKVLTRRGAEDFCFGTAPTLADCCLAPQVFNAERLNADLSAMPAVRRIHANCMALEAFAAAAPARQPDAE
jgi:maleylpyruvate isomerase